MPVKWLGRGEIIDMKVEDCKITANDEICKDIYRMEINCPNISVLANAGQFLHIRITNSYDPLLRRPLSICSIDSVKGNILLLYRIAGKGTSLLSKKKPGETINVMGPLGKGFPLFKNKKAAIIGGGIGVAPLFELSKHLVSPDIYLGYKSDAYLIEDFTKYGKLVHICTEDGLVGTKGYPIELFSSNINSYDIVYACGPKVMMKAVKNICEEKGVECYLSMEENMGCGIGACLTCSCKSKVDGEYKRVCIDGPVFNSKEVEL